MYQRILATLDGSRFSEEILPWAAGMAASLGATLELLRVVEKESASAEATDYVQRLAAQYAAHGQCRPTRGTVAEAILLEARATPDTLVAMTSRGHSGLMEALLGSVALQVVRASHGAPVLVYHPKGASPAAKAIGIRHIMLPLEGTHLSEDFAPQVAELARALGADLMVLAAARPEDLEQAGDSGRDQVYVRAHAQELAKRFGISVNWDMLQGEPVGAIVGYLQGRQDTILAMTTRGRSALESAFIGSVTAGCLRKAGVPVLMRAP